MTAEKEVEVPWPVVEPSFVPNSPRPLLFVRLPLRVGGQAEFVNSVLSDAEQVLLNELRTLGETGTKTDVPRVKQVRSELYHLGKIRHDIVRELETPYGLGPTINCRVFREGGATIFRSVLSQRFDGLLAYMALGRDSGLTEDQLADTRVQLDDLIEVLILLLAAMVELAGADADPR